MPQSTSTASSVRGLAGAKRGAVLDAASQRGCSGVVARSPATVRWLLCGRGRPVSATAPRADYAVVLAEGRALVLHPDIEASRVESEERLEELGFRVETFPWHEGPEGALADLADGFASDDELEEAIRPLRMNLREEELDRYRAAGRAAADAMAETIQTVAPDWRELDAAGELAASCRRRGFVTPVVLAGGEGRQEVHRHPLPTDAPLGRHALLAVTAEREGLHVSLTRIVSFGPPPEALEGLVRISAEVDAAMLAASRPGVPVNEILDVAAKAYELHGFPEEWRRHHQGGIAGYSGREVFATPDDMTPLPPAGAVAWNPSVTGGGKSEDTALVTEDGIEVVTRTPELPELEFGGVARAGIFVR